MKVTNIDKYHQKFEIRRCQRTQEIEKYHLLKDKDLIEKLTSIAKNDVWKWRLCKKPYEITPIDLQLMKLRTTYPNSKFLKNRFLVVFLGFQSVKKTLWELNDGGLMFSSKKTDKKWNFVKKSFGLKENAAGKWRKKKKTKLEVTC